MPHTKEDCKKYLEKKIKKHKLDQFFKDPSIVDKIAENAETNLEKWRGRVDTLFSHAEMSDYAYWMLLVSLYHVHILLDDSGSMMEDDRVKFAKELIDHIIDIDSTLIEKGVRLHLLNGQDPPEAIESVDDFNKWAENLEFGGPTKLGTTVKDKIWSPILKDRAKFIRPCLVYIITDGAPTAEPKDALEKSLLRCKDDLTADGYSQTAIAFGIIQVGNDEGCRKFLDDLAEHQDLKDHLDVVNEDVELENHFRESQGRLREERSPIIMEMLVGAIERPVTATL